MRIFFFLLFLHVLTGFGCAATEKLRMEGNCQPCSVLVSPKNKFLFYYEIKEVDGEILVKTIRVTTSEGKTTQNLEVKGMTPVIDFDELFLGSSDLNFDGINDIYLITSRGSTNTYANYWIFDKADEKFIPVGVFPIFKVDYNNKTLSTHENIGSAGREYVRRIYTIKDRGFELVYEEKQLIDPKTGKFKLSKGKPLN